MINTVVPSSQWDEHIFLASFRWRYGSARITLTGVQRKYAEFKVGDRTHFVDWATLVEKARVGDLVLQPQDEVAVGEWSDFVNRRFETRLGQVYYASPVVESGSINKQYLYLWRRTDVPVGRWDVKDVARAVSRGEWKVLSD